jgi:hypothetical protein
MVNGRPSIVGDDAGPTAPYPLTMEGKVISGFGRGSKEVSGVTHTNIHILFMSHTNGYRSSGSPPQTSL